MYYAFEVFILFFALMLDTLSLDLLGFFNDVDNVMVLDKFFGIASTALQSQIYIVMKVPDDD